MTCCPAAKRLLGFGLLIALAIGILSISTRAAQNAPRTTPAINGGNGTLYIGGYPNSIWIIDEATEKIVETITLQTGFPRRAELSPDLQRFYVLSAEMERIEIVDLPNRKTIDTFTLTNRARKVRIRAMKPDPRHRFLMLVTRSATKRDDRFEISPSTLVQYDLKEHKIVRTIPWPDGQERDNADLQFSPDGKLLYLMSDDVLIFETENFTQVDKWEVSRPLEDGMGRLSFGLNENFFEEPGFYTGLFSMDDPVQRRRLMGLGRVDLAHKKIEFHPLGPAVNLRFALAPGRKKAYGLFQEIGKYEFWEFDLEKRQIVKRGHEFEGRPRMSLKTSSNGKVLYIYTAGNTIDLYDASTFKYMRTITLGGDQNTELYVVPAKTGVSATQ
jgi:hypothetical protein